MDNPEITPNSLKHNKDILISYYEKLTEKISSNVEINQVFEMIRSDSELQKKVERIRKEPDKTKADFIKKTLPSVTFSGLFDGRRKLDRLLNTVELFALISMILKNRQR